MKKDDLFSLHPFGFYRSEAKIALTWFTEYIPRMWVIVLVGG
jgi:hypothetical protein